MREPSKLLSGHPKVTIYTDGGCAKNPGGPGGWAAVIIHGRMIREVCGGTDSTTNNRMELTAAIQGLKALNRPCSVVLFTDSQYLQNGISKWIKTWVRRGWKTQEGEAVKNQDLWQELHSEASRHQISWQWCKGHANNKWNERCDLLATKMIKAFRGCGVKTQN